MHCVGHLVGQIPETGSRVQADHRGRSPATDRHEIQVRSRWSIRYAINPAGEFHQRTAVTQPIQILPACSASNQLGRGDGAAGAPDDIEQ